ncbi:aspartate/glutamate racemase family protein [Hanstruepera ponticola]|uniref:aspartate/glutamate racemase family protein n=1 Tax=Hanstruepera ponticola TaxID=2042995 RepID=UPI00177DE567|nr:aspartate/glutamate racemase family protein [Hanstruepera ponticola]
MIETKAHINILGLGSRSTLFYLESLNNLYHTYLGDYHTFPCTVHNKDFNTINPFLPNQFERLVPNLQNYLNDIESTSNGYLIIPNITLHEAYDRCQSKLKILHPLQLAADHISNKSIKKITLLGSKYTMESDYISAFIKRLHIDIVIPKEQDKEVIDTLRKAVYRNPLTDEHLDIYNNLIADYTKDSHALIACSELSILNNIFQNNKTIDMAELQIQAAVQKLLTLNATK